MPASKRKDRSETGGRNRNVGTAPEIAHGHSCSIHPDKGLGHIQTRDGRVICFYKDGVVDRPFGGLATGTEVRFAEESGPKGCRANVPHVID
jgi:cold shock CspA family protein